MRIGVSAPSIGLSKQIGTGSVPHRANLSLEAGVRLKPELLSAFLALTPPGAIRLLGQDHRAADQLPGDSVERDGNELLFHCLLMASSNASVGTPECAFSPGSEWIKGSKGVRAGPFNLAQDGPFDFFRAGFDIVTSRRVPWAGSALSHQEDRLIPLSPEG